MLTAKLAREALGTDLIKVEVIGDAETLYPDTRETIAACEELVRLGFTVLPYIVDDPVACKRLEEVGCAAVMPLAAPIGSGLGVCNPYSIAIIKERAKVPVIVDAGRRDRQRRGDRDGARRRRPADEHRDRRGARSGAHGARDARRGQCRPQRVPRRADAEAALRQRVEPDDRPDRHARSPARERDQRLANSPQARRR